MPSNTNLTHTLGVCHHYQCEVFFPNQTTHFKCRVLVLGIVSSLMGSLSGIQGSVPGPGQRPHCNTPSEALQGDARGTSRGTVPRTGKAVSGEHSQKSPWGSCSLFPPPPASRDAWHKQKARVCRQRRRTSCRALPAACQPQPVVRAAGNGGSQSKGITHPCAKPHVCGNRQARRGCHLVKTHFTEGFPAEDHHEPHVHY